MADILDPRTPGVSVSPYPPELQGEAAALHRRRALADMLMLRSMQPLQQPTGYGGIPVPISPLAGLAHIAQAGLGSMAGTGVDAREADLAQRYSAGLQDATTQATDLMKQGKYDEASKITQRWPALKAISEKLLERQIAPRPTFHPFETASPEGLPQTSFYDPNNPPAGPTPKPAPLHTVPLGGTTQLVSPYGPERTLPHTLDPNRVPTPEDMEADAKMIEEYRKPGYGTSGGRMSPWQVATMRRVEEISKAAGRSYDISVFPVVKAGEQEFNQKNAPVVRSFGTLVGHVQAAKQLFAALDNPSDVQRINQARNFFAQEFGYPAPGNVDVAKQFIADESVKAVLGAPGALDDRKAMAAKLSRASSAAQFNTDADTVIHFGVENMKNHLQQLKGMTKGKRAEEDFIQYLSPNARQAFFQYGGSDRRKGPQEGLAAPRGGAPGSPGQVLKFDAQGNLIQ